jgi:hypothetical protein
LQAGDREDGTAQQGNEMGGKSRWKAKDFENLHSLKTFN